MNKKCACRQCHRNKIIGIIYGDKSVDLFDKGTGTLHSIENGVVRVDLPDGGWIKAPRELFRRGDSIRSTKHLTELLRATVEENSGYFVNEVTFEQPVGQQMRMVIYCIPKEDRHHG